MTKSDFGGSLAGVNILKSMLSPVMYKNYFNVALYLFYLLENAWKE